MDRGRGWASTRGRGRSSNRGRGGTLARPEVKPLSSLAGPAPTDLTSTPFGRTDSATCKDLTTSSRTEPGTKHSSWSSSRGGRFLHARPSRSNGFQARSSNNSRSSFRGNVGPCGSSRARFGHQLEERQVLLTYLCHNFSCQRNCSL